MSRSKKERQITYYEVIKKKDEELVMRVYLMNEAIHEMIKRHKKVWNLYVIYHEELRMKDF